MARVNKRPLKHLTTALEKLPILHPNTRITYKLWNKVLTKASHEPSHTMIPGLTRSAPASAEIICRDPVKLWIADVLKLEKSPANEMYAFRKKFLSKVDIAGIITQWNPLKDEKLLFTVDDGTGFIPCYVNRRNLYTKVDDKLMSLKNETEENASHLDEEVKTALLALVSHTMKEQKRIRTFQAGDCVQVQGFISIFDGERSINAFSICVMSPEMEVNRKCEMHVLYRDLYGPEIVHSGMDDVKEEK